MDVLFTHCAGLDVHKKTVVACVIIPAPTGGCVQRNPNVQYDDRRSLGSF